MYAPRLLATLTLLSCLGPAGAQVRPTAPDKFFGHQLGADRKLARWDRIVEYLRLLERESGGRLKVVNMGPSTEGHPFLLVIVTSAANMNALERIRETNARLSDPRGLTEDQARRLASEAKAVVVQTMSLHANEVGGTQMAPELAYDLIARDDEETSRILSNVITLLIPSFNPDGQIMVTDYYNKYLGTEYEAGPLPWLYQKYAGHDNNRDAFALNLVESQYVAKVMFRDWRPQAYVDHHHMGPYGARIYIPPYAEPVRPSADPLIWREMSWFGAHMAYKEEEANLSGVLNAAVYSGWGHFGFHWITPFHNIAGMLTESAGVRVATPIYIHPEQLRGDTRGMPEYEEQTTFPNPWPGGWWRLRDIVERQKVSAWAVLDLAARNRETVVWNAYLKARRQSERGAAGTPAAYVVPLAQHDRLTAIKLVNRMLAQGVEVDQLTADLKLASGMSYPAGSWLVPMAQPKMGLIRYLLGRTFYPDNEWTRNRNGSPMSPYDMATDTMFEFMGVRVDPLEAAPASGLRPLPAPIVPTGEVAAGGGWVFDGRQNASYWAANRLLDKGAVLRRADKAGNGVQPGDFVLAGNHAELLRAVAKETGVSFAALRPDAPIAAHELKRMRTAMYQRYRGGNMDEGWTRLLLEQYGFPYATLMDAELKKGSLHEKFDVIVLPEDSSTAITGDRTASPGGRGGGQGRDDSAIPPEYRSGIGKEGVAALKDFVEKGGTLVALGGSSRFAIETLSLELRDIAAGRDTREFWCPGSTLRMRFDTSHPLAYGMPAEGLGTYFMGNPAFEVTASAKADQYETVARFAPRDLLESGWLIGEQVLARRSAIVIARAGKGRAILYGVRVQHRAQTDGTFKLLFNALLQ